MTAQAPPTPRIAPLLVLGLLALLLAPVVRADPDLQTGSELATVTWSMDDPAGLSLDRTTIENGSAVLAWIPRTTNWSRAADFTANGVFDPTIVAHPSGVQLAADGRNHVADGDFSSPGPWQALPSSNVSVIEEAPWNDAYLGHVSDPPARALFDGLDIDNDVNWTNTGSAGSTCVHQWVAPGHNSTGRMLQCTITLGSLNGSWAGVARVSANWSGHNRLLVWVYADDPSPFTWAFQVTAMVGLASRSTSLQPLKVGWQEIVVDLTPLGPDLSTLTNVRLLAVGQFIDNARVAFDDLRLTTANAFNETGRLRQDISKPNATSANPGSGNLAFDYEVVNRTGAAAFEVTARIDGPGGSMSMPIPLTNLGAWTPLSLDVSAATAASGLYTVGFEARIQVDTVGSTNASIRIDNVRLEFPNRAAGSFVSAAIDAGAISEFIRLEWAGSVPAQTSAILQLRTGNESDLGGPSWSAWRTWDVPGADDPDLGPSRFYQVRVSLDTTNASRTPIVEAVSVGVRSRSATGYVLGSYSVDDAAFQSWAMLEVRTLSGDPPIGVFVDRGQGWEPASPRTDLSSTSSRVLAWRVELTTTDGSITPHVSSLVLTYRIGSAISNLARILLSPLALASLVAAGLVGYSTYAVVQRRAFAVDDVFLISREGRLLMHNTRRMRPDRDEDILSGMLTAILAFVKDSDPEGNGELRHFRVGDRTTVLERGAHSYVAAVYSGRVPRWAGKDLRRFLRDVEARFGTAFARWSGDPDDLQGLKELTGRFVSRLRYRSPREGSAAST